MQELLGYLSLDIETAFFALKTSGKILGMGVMVLGPAVLLARFSS